MAKTETKVLNLSSFEADVKKALQLAESLQEIGSSLGFNVFQPGAMKELKMAAILGHNWILSKKNADACSRADSNEVYEYLSGTEDGAGQIDRVFKDDPNDVEQHEKYLQSMDRIERNKAFYLAYTNSNTSKPLDILRIYEVTPAAIREETDRQLQNSTNKISHVSFNENFARAKGTLIWSKK